MLEDVEFSIMCFVLLLFQSMDFANFFPCLHFFLYVIWMHLC